LGQKVPKYNFHREYILNETILNLKAALQTTIRLAPNDIMALTLFNFNSSISTNSMHDI